MSGNATTRKTCGLPPEIETWPATSCFSLTTCHGSPSTPSHRAASLESERWRSHLARWFVEGRLGRLAMLVRGGVNPLTAGGLGHCRGPLKDDPNRDFVTDFLFCNFKMDPWQKLFSSRRPFYARRPQFAEHRAFQVRVAGLPDCACLVCALVRSLAPQFVRACKNTITTCRTDPSVEERATTTKRNNPNRSSRAFQVRVAGLPDCACLMRALVRSLAPQCMQKHCAAFSCVSQHTARSRLAGLIVDERLDLENQDVAARIGARRAEGASQWTVLVRARSLAPQFVRACMRTALYSNRNSAFSTQLASAEWLFGPSSPSPFKSG